MPKKKIKDLTLEDMLRFCDNQNHAWCNCPLRRFCFKEIGQSIHNFFIFNKEYLEEEVEINE